MLIEKTNLGMAGLLHDPKIRYTELKSNYFKFIIKKHLLIKSKHL